MNRINISLLNKAYLTDNLEVYHISDANILPETNVIATSEINFNSLDSIIKLIVNRIQHINKIIESNDFIILYLIEALVM